MTSANIPVFSALQNWNLLVGFGLICIGFGLSTQWR
ncbi:MAG TPA: cell division protein CrgA [Actinomycetes bacterium]